METLVTQLSSIAPGALLIILVVLVGWQIKMTIAIQTALAVLERDYAQIVREMKKQENVLAELAVIRDNVDRHDKELELAFERIREVEKR
jgi:hypothetical protein